MIRDFNNQSLSGNTIPYIPLWGNQIWQFSGQGFAAYFHYCYPAPKPLLPQGIPKQGNIFRSSVIVMLSLWLCQCGTFLIFFQRKKWISRAPFILFSLFTRPNYFFTGTLPNFFGFFHLHLFLFQNLGFYLFVCIDYKKKMKNFHSKMFLSRVCF